MQRFSEKAVEDVFDFDVESLRLTPAINKLRCETPRILA
jgi:hypothetical protein